MNVLILCQGKTGSTALLESIAVYGNKTRVMEPANLCDLQLNEKKNIVAKKLIEYYRENEDECISFFDKKLFLVRDPRDALVSRILYMPYRKTGFNDDRKTSEFVQLIRKKCDNPSKINFTTIIDKYDQIVGVNILQQIDRLNKKVIKLWKNFYNVFFLVKYEDFIQNNNEKLKNYLGHDLSSTIVVPTRFQRVTRTKSKGDWKNWFNEQDNDFFNIFLKDYLICFGYEEQPVSVYPEIKREFADLYVVRVINDGRKADNIPLFNWK